MDENRTYGTGDTNFDRVYENALNGIDPDSLTEEERAAHEIWVNTNWDDLNTEPADHSDDICPCGDPDCSRPFPHSVDEN